MIKTTNVNKTVFTQGQPLTILSDINLSINTGQSVAIVGASGSGKTTLLGLLAGLDTPTSGDIWLADKNIAKLDEEARALTRRQYVGFIFQNFQLLDSLSALENVMLPLEVNGNPQAREAAQTYLNKVGLCHRFHHNPKQLSGGEQQRVAIARAFACQAPIIFADEPTGSLDTKTGGAISDLLFELNRETQTTLVLVTHSETLAKSCERQLTIANGSVSEHA